LYTSIDLGSHSIKIIVSEYVDNRYHVLASTKVRSIGIKRGIIRDKELALQSLNTAIDNINNDLGIKIKKVLLNFPLYRLNTTIETGEIEIENIVSGDDIRKVIKKTIFENVSDDLEVVYLEPIVFEVDSNIQVVDPKGLETKHLSVRLAVSTIEKSILYDYLKLLQEADLEVEDLVYGIVGDYFESTNKEIDKKLGVVLNIGYSKSEIAIFNKGIMLKGGCLPIGSKKIDKDISYIYKISMEDASSLKENFASASFKYADKNDVVEIVNISGEKCVINQLEISQIVEARLMDILKSVKQEINNLTNREISYIIITGGITNLLGFPYLLDSEFEYEKIICNIPTVGIRNNVFSTSFGLIKYFDGKMKFREIDYTMFNKDEIEQLSKKKNNCSNNNLINKIKDYIK